MGDLNTSHNQSLSREDCLNAYQKHLDENRLPYHGAMENYASQMAPLLSSGISPFAVEGWREILINDSLFKKSIEMASRSFASNPELKKRFTDIMNNSRETALTIDLGSRSAEGWGGGTSIYASSLGAFGAGTLPFVIGGWMCTSQSEEIYHHISDQNNMRLEFEYNIDYLMVGDTKFYYPNAHRAGEITGFNKLPKIDWTTPNSSSGHYQAPDGANWALENQFINVAPVTNALSSSVTGNVLTVSGRNLKAYGVEPNCRISAIKFKGKDSKSHIKRLSKHYEIITGPTNQRIFNVHIDLENVNGYEDDVIPVDIVMKIILDTGDFQLFVASDTKEHMACIEAIQFDGRVSNIGNEMTDIPTEGTEKIQFICECEYRQYAKVSLNEYMSDNFRIGASNNITYAAYASDKLLQTVHFNRELEGEEYFISEVLDDDVDPTDFYLTKKLGAFVHNNLKFTIGSYTPGLGLQDYKFGLKSYLTDVLHISDTDLNIPKNVKREWILLGYDPIVAQFPEIKFETTAVDLNSNPEGSATNDNYGFAVGSKPGFIDSLGRSIRIIGNSDARWRDRGGYVYGALKTYSMEYPFLVYYPHAIRMFTAIDADLPNRTAIYIGGREYRGHFAGAAIRMQISGVLDEHGMPINKYEAQIADSKRGYTVTTSSDSNSIAKVQVEGTVTTSAAGVGG